MKTQIAEIQRVTVITEKDINFPYIGWLSKDKEEIIKIDCEYFNYLLDIPKHLKCVVVKNDIKYTPSITTSYTSVSNDVINGDILPLLRDYADLATEEEFNLFMDATFEAIKKYF